MNRRFYYKYPRSFLVLLASLWIIIYQILAPLSELLVTTLPIDRTTHLGTALQFFFYDTPKILLLLTGVVFVMGIVNSYFTPEYIRALLVGQLGAGANIMAAGLGVLTPFCSCSAVPLFIGFIQAGIPLGVTFSFLIAAPMVNEVALVLLYELSGGKIAVLYLSFGLVIAITSGWIIGGLQLEGYLADWVRNLPKTQAQQDFRPQNLPERIENGFTAIHDIVGKVWPYILAGISIGAIIHGYVPESYMVSVMGTKNWWSVPLAILIGIPLYANAASIIPIVQALLAKGAAMGTVLAFMMSVIGLSLPEIIILRKVLKFRLILIFVAIVAIGILLVGYSFNAIL